MKSQFVTSKMGRGGKQKLPLVFTENGLAMLSGVLNSARAVQVHIAIMRIFTRLRSFLALENTLSDRITKLEDGTNKLFKVVFEMLDAFEDETPILKPIRKKIGLKSKN